MLLDIGTRQRVVCKAAPVLIGALGLYIIGGIWWGIIFRHEFEGWFDIVFLFIFPIPMTLLAAYFFYAAVKIWQDFSYKSICKLSGVISIIFIWLLLPIADKLMAIDYDSHDAFRSELQFVLLMIAGGLFYLGLKRLLLKWLCIEEKFNYQDHLRGTKLYFGFLAFFMWGAMATTVELLPRDPEHEHSAANFPLSFAITFGSIPAAIFLYRFCLRLFLKKPPEGIADEVEDADAGNESIAIEGNEITDDSPPGKYIKVKRWGKSLVVIGVCTSFLSTLFCLVRACPWHVSSFVV